MWRTQTEVYIIWSIYLEFIFMLFIGMLKFVDIVFAVIFPDWNALETFPLDELVRKLYKYI